MDPSNNKVTAVII